MMSLLVWLLALPTRVLRLLRSLLGRLVHFRAGRAGPRDRVMASLRRRYPDAPEVWLEMVARNTRPVFEPADELPMRELSAIEEQAQVGVLPPTGSGASRWHGKSAQVVSIGPRRLKSATSRAAAIEHDEPMAMAQEPRTALRSRARAKAVAPVATKPAWRQAEQESGRVKSRSATAAPPFPTVAESPLTWPTFQEEPTALSRATTQLSVASAAPEPDPWPELSTEIAPSDAKFPGATSMAPKHPRWRDDPGADQWPALLPATPQPAAVRIASISERIARLRAIQERL